MLEERRYIDPEWAETVRQIVPKDNSAFEQNFQSSETAAREWQEKQQQRQIRQREVLNAETRRHQEEQQRLESEQRAEQEKKEAEANLPASMTELQKEIYEICRRQNDPAMHLYHELERGRWTHAEDQAEVARTIRERWQQDEIWNPEFPGTNKGKVKRRERCLKVLSYLPD